MWTRELDRSPWFNKPMVDIWTALKRSDVMRKVRLRGNRSTELCLIEIFRANKIISWRCHQRVCWYPDFIFRTQRVCVFVDSCFWNGCPECYRRPAANQGYWDAKVQRNKDRDREVGRELLKLGWRVLRIWEHQLLEKHRAALLRRFKRNFLLR